MNNTAALLWGLLFSSIGLGYFIYGKKQSHKVALYCGISLMVYPFFTEETLSLVLIGSGLLALPFVLKL